MPPSKTQPRPLQGCRDEELIRKFKETRDMLYFSEIFQRYNLPILQLCRRKLIEEEDSRDTAMRVFEKCLLDPPGLLTHSFKSWLLQVARNECVNQLRARRQLKQKAALAEETWYKMPFDDGAGLPVTAPWIDSGPHLQKALAALPPLQRKCIELFFFQQKSYREIAAATSLSPDQVKSHLQNGKRRLRRLLSNET